MEGFKWELILSADAGVLLVIGFYAKSMKINYQKNWKMLKKQLFFIYILFYLILLIILNQGLFHHDAIQLSLAVENKEISNIVNNRIGMYYLYYFSNFELIPIIISIASILVVYLIGKNLFDDGAGLAILFSLIPPFISISTYVNSNSIYLLLLLSSFYLFIRRMYIPSILIIGISLLFRTECIFMLIVYIVDFMRKKDYNSAAIYFSLFLVTSPLLFWQSGSNDVDLSLNLIITFIAILSLGIIPFYLILTRKNNRIYLLSGMLLLFPFIFVPTAKARMIILPLFFIILSIYKNKNLMYFFIPMVLISLFLIFSYLYYDSMDDLIIKEQLCKDIDYFDYSLFFEYYGSEECKEYNINKSVLLYQNSDVFPNVKRILIMNDTMVLE